MSESHRPWVRSATIGLAACALAIGGCHKKDHMEAELPPPPPPAVDAPAAEPTLSPQAPALQLQPGLAPRQRLARAVDLLQSGDQALAQIELAEALRVKPNLREARVLQQTIETDPKTLFGMESFAYQVGSRDTLVSLAVDFFHDSYKFYGLARYNGIAIPSSLKPGDTIQIPGRARSAYHPWTRRSGAVSRGSEAVPPDQVATPAPPAVDPARAQKLRRAGLERLSAGAVDQAVGLLGQAAALDPGNAAIAGDLDRARRIQGAVHSRR